MAELTQREVDAIYALRHAADWIASAPHGDNCFVSDHYEGDPGNRCNCGKDSAEQAIHEALGGYPESMDDDGEPLEVSAATGWRNVNNEFCPVFVKDPAADVPEVDRVQRLMDACEGEVGGLALSRSAARRILAFVDGGISALIQEAGRLGEEADAGVKGLDDGQAS